MLQTILKHVGLFFLLIALQALVFNNVHIAGYATPQPYVYLLILLPSNTPRAILLGVGFITGLIVDMFANTPGVSAAAMTFVGLIRPYLLEFFAPSDKDDDAFTPSSLSMKWGPFFRYAAICTLVHEVGFFLLEAFSLFNWADLLINIFGSFALTLIIICAFESIGSGKSKAPAKR